MEEAMEGFTTVGKWGLGIPAWCSVYLITAKTTKNFREILRLKMSRKARLYATCFPMCYTIYMRLLCICHRTLYYYSHLCYINPRTQSKGRRRASCSGFCDESMHTALHSLALPQALLCLATAIQYIDSPTMPKHSNSCNRARCLSLCTTGRFSVAYSFRHCWY